MQAAARSPCEIPQQVGVNVAEQNVPRLGTLANAGHVVENPAYFQSAEISSERQPGFDAKPIKPALARQVRDVVPDASVLPDQSVVNGTPCDSIPNHRSFPLIGDSNRGKIAGFEALPLHRFTNDFLGPAPDLGRVVFDPSRLRKNLFVLLLGDRNDASGTVEYDESRAGGALIDSSDVVRHGPSSFQKRVRGRAAPARASGRCLRSCG